MRMRQVFLGKDFLGEAPAVRMPDLSEAGDGFFQMSLLFVSPITGDVWARLPVVDGQKIQPYCVLMAYRERESSWGHSPPGSLLVGGVDLLRQLPPRAIQREFFLHLNLSQGVIDANSQATNQSLAGSPA